MLSMRAEHIFADKMFVQPSDRRIKLRFMFRNLLKTRESTCLVICLQREVAQLFGRESCPFLNQHYS